MATDTGRRKPNVLVLSSTGVAGLTGSCGMSPQQRKPCVLVLLHHVVDEPGLGRMAMITTGGELSFVHVGMASMTGPVLQ